MGRPATGQTTPRAIRIPDPLWESALKIAKSRGETLSDVVRESMAEYVASGGVRSGIYNRGKIPAPERVAAEEPRETP
jgi:hypothetical protein